MNELMGGGIHVLFSWWMKYGLIHLWSGRKMHDGWLEGMME